MTSKKRESRAWIPAFLEALGKTGNVRLSCGHAQISRNSAYATRARDQGFAEQWDDAIDEAVDILEQECRRRAIQGVERERWVRVGSDEDGRPKFKQVVEREFSDNLLMFLLKAHRPDKFRDNFDFKSMVAALASVQGSSDVGQSGTPAAPARKRSHRGG